MAHRRAFVIGLLFVWALAFTPAAAQETAFEIPGVEVDVTAESAAQARAQALADGERLAFDLLLRRLTMQNEHGRLPAISNLAISNLVTDFTIDDEKASDVRYLASLGFSFNPQGVREVLRAAAIPFAETVSKPLVLLPVIGNATGRRLWDEPNPWREAWAIASPRWDLVPILQPIGDLQDITSITAEQAAEGDADALGKIALRYGTDGALVAVMTLNQNERGRARVSVSATSFISGRLRQTFSFGLNAQPDEPGPDLMIRAVDETRRQLEDNWKRDNLILFDSQSVLQAKVPISSLAGWVDLKRRIGAVAMVTNTQVISMSRQDVQLTLQYMGELDQLTLAMKQQDLDIRTEAGDWVIRDLGAPPPAIPVLDPVSGTVNPPVETRRDADTAQ